MSGGEPNLPRVIAAGDAAAMVAFSDEISLEVNARVHALSDELRRRKVRGILDQVVAYSTLLINYDPLEVDLREIEVAVRAAMAGISGRVAAEPRLKELPTVYGGSYGPDLPEVARRAGLSEQEVIALHSGAAHTVYMLGFAPGAPYMGGLPPQLALPRLDAPRERVPAGTVAIANQTTVYAMTTPGGWWWLGRTAIRLFDPSKDPPTYLAAGDSVRFIPITEQEYLDAGGERCT